MNIASKIASLIQARDNCFASGNTEWFDKHTKALHAIEHCLLPGGSGIDSGTKVDLAYSTPVKLVLHASFHHMNETGTYDGWTEHKIIVRPTFSGIDVDVTGRDRNSIKDYLADTYSIALSALYTENQS